MRRSAAPITGRRQLPWLRKHGFAVRLAAASSSMCFATVVVDPAESWKPENNLFWVANGLLLAYLLLAPRWRWPAYLLTGFLALSLRSVLYPPRWNEFLLYNMLNIRRGADWRSSVAAPFDDASALYRTQLPDPVRRLCRSGWASVAASDLVLAAPFGGIHPAIPFSAGWPPTASASPLPRRPSQPSSRPASGTLPIWRQHWFYPLLLLGVTFAAFAQNAVPLVYLIYPLLVLILVRLGLGYASLFTLLTASIAGWMTIRGYGPFAQAAATNTSLPSLHLQISVASAIVLIYSVSVVLESRRLRSAALRKIAALHQMVTENSRDVIILADFHGHRTYVSAATLTMGGWKPEEAGQPRKF